MKQQPNILFIFSDQQHWQAVEFQDSSFQSPNLNKLAAEGTVFTNSFCTTPQCSPSRSSMMTGLYPTKTGVLGNIGAAGGQALRVPTIGGVLRGAGYRTAYFGKWHLGKDSVGISGWDEDYGVTGPETTEDTEVTRQAVDFLKDTSQYKQPFALFLSYNNPHDIYHFKRGPNPVPRGSVRLPHTWHHKDLSITPPVQKQFMIEDQGQVIANATSHTWQRYRELYREKVKLYDDELGKVLGTLEECSLSGSTLVVATSDHGDMDTQHGLIYKGPFMYEHMIRVPLIFKIPDTANLNKAGSTVVFPTVNVDLAPTLADFAGATIAKTDGISLKPLLTGEGQTIQRDFIVGQYYSKQRWVNPIRMIRTNHYKYNLYRVYGEELYDLECDPSELHNVESERRYEEVKSSLNALLTRWLKDNGDPFHSQNPTTRDGKALTG